MLVVSNHQDRIAERNSEQRDEANHAAQRQHAACSEHGEHAADEGKRQVRQDQEKVAPVARDDRKQENNADTRDSSVDGEVACEATLSFVIPGEGVLR